MRARFLPTTLQYSNLEVLDILTPADYERLYGWVKSGVEAFKEVKDLEASLKFYKKALDQVMEKLAAVLWFRRSKTFEKRKEYELTLAEATWITQYSPCWSLGYLQSSKIVLHLCKFEEALATLDTAEQLVPETDAHYKVLAQQIKHNLSLIHKRNMHDLGRLSAEILDMIFSQLQRKDHIKCLRVCKGLERMC